MIYFAFEIFILNPHFIFDHSQERVQDEEEQVDHDAYDVKKIYWDNDGNLRHGILFYIFCTLCMNYINFYN